MIKDPLCLGPNMEVFKMRINDKTWDNLLFARVSILSLELGKFSKTLNM